MSLNRMVSFHGGSLASPAPRIRQLGLFTTPQPGIKVEEALPLAAGGGLLIAGAVMKGKGGTVMMVLGGLSALIGGGTWLYRTMFGQPTTVVAPLNNPPPPPAKPAAKSVYQQLAPVADSLAPLLKNLFSSGSSAPAPGGMVTSYSQLAPAPVPSGGGGGFVTSY